MKNQQKKPIVLHTRERLDQTALDIEFLLISVVQGVALAALASASSELIGELQFATWPYIISAFLLILNFWSQAIIHAISFIDWPFDLLHNFLYFLASLIEVMAFSHMTDPLRWFGFVTAFLFVASVMYYVDLQLIKQHKTKFQGGENIRIYNHILSRQTLELNIFVPLAFLFNGVAFASLILYPDIFLKGNYHFVFIILQVIFGFIVLMSSVRSFKTRSRLITDALQK